jgi:phospholipase C
MATIGDELSDKGISWAWYAGGWKDAVENHPDKTFQYHHQPFAYFRKYAPGQPGREHLKDEEDFEKQSRQTTCLRSEPSAGAPARGSPSD